MIEKTLRQIVANTLHSYADNITSGNTNLTIDQATSILESIAHIEFSKEEACDFLNIRRSRFDDLVREGKLPRGRKVKHKTNLIWYKDELLCAIANKE